MGREKKIVGMAGERIASSYLKKKGYRILGSNIRTPFGEIDLVAKRNGAIVFVEVRSRLSNSFGPPYLSVTQVKQRRIIRNAVFYLKSRRLININWRIDVVSIKLNLLHESEKIEHFENAVEDPYI